MPCAGVHDAGHYALYLLAAQARIAHQECAPLRSCVDVGLLAFVLAANSPALPVPRDRARPAARCERRHVPLIDRRYAAHAGRLLRSAQLQALAVGPAADDAV